MSSCCRIKTAHVNVSRNKLHENDYTIPSPLATERRTKAITGKSYFYNALSSNNQSRAKTIENRLTYVKVMGEDKAGIFETRCRYAHAQVFTLLYMPTCSSPLCYDVLFICKGSFRFELCRWTNEIASICLSFFQQEKAWFNFHIFIRIRLQTRGNVECIMYPDPGNILDIYTESKQRIQQKLDNCNCHGQLPGFTIQIYITSSFMIGFWRNLVGMDCYITPCCHVGDLLFDDLDLLLQVKLEIGPKFVVIVLAKTVNCRNILVVPQDGYYYELGLIELWWRSIKYSLQY